MQTMTLNKLVTLQRREQAYGDSSEYTVISEKTVFCSERTPSLSFRNNAQTAGFQTDKIIHLWRRDFEADTFTHVIVDNVEYRIENIGSSINDLFVKLSLARGV